MAKRVMGKGLGAILGDEAAKVNNVRDKGAQKLVGTVATFHWTELPPTPSNLDGILMMMPLLN